METNVSVSPPKKACISYQTPTHVTLYHFCKRLRSCRWTSNVIYLVTWVIGTGTSITHTPTREWPSFCCRGVTKYVMCFLSLCVCVFMCVYVRMATSPSLHVCVAMRWLAAPANAQIVHSGAACNVKDDNISERIYTIKEGDALVLQCIVKGHPRPQVSSQTACWCTVICMLMPILLTFSEWAGRVWDNCSRTLGVSRGSEHKLSAIQVAALSLITAHELNTATDVWMNEWSLPLLRQIMHGLFRLRSYKTTRQLFFSILICQGHQSAPCIYEFF